MGSFVVKNNVESLVVNDPLAQAATTLNITPSSGSSFPSTFPFLITLWDDSAFPDPGDDSGMEIVKCTGRTTDALTIVRGQESTSDVAHTLGERVAMLITAGIFNDATYGVSTKIDGIEAGATANPLAPKMATGSYTGNDGVNRAIAHGLGIKPKIIFLTRSGATSATLQNDTVWNITRQSNLVEIQAVTAKDATNFYVTGNLNMGPEGYAFIAIG